MSAETLTFNPQLGEVDPRTYPLLGLVRFASNKIGSTERISQANRLIYAVDKIAEQEGEPRARIHLTIPIGGSATHAVEVRIQPLTQRSEAADRSLAAKVKARWDEIMAIGEGRWKAV